MLSVARVRLEDLQQAVHLARARPGDAVDLADIDLATPAIEDASWPQPVGAEVDETAHDTRRAGAPGDLELVQAILCRQDEPVRSQMRQQRIERGSGRLRLHREHDSPIGAAELVGSHGRNALREVLDVAFDRQSCAAAGLDVLAHDVHDHDRDAGTRPIGGDRAPYCAASPDDDGFAGRIHLAILSILQRTSSARSETRNTPVRPCASLVRDGITGIHGGSGNHAVRISRGPAPGQAPRAGTARTGSSDPRRGDRLPAGSLQRSASSTARCL
jgi:hypothetical protein